MNEKYYTLESMGLWVDWEKLSIRVAPISCPKLFPFETTEELTQNLLSRVQLTSWERIETKKLIERNLEHCEIHPVKIKREKRRA